MAVTLSHIINTSLEFAGIITSRLDLSVGIGLSFLNCSVVSSVRFNTDVEETEQ
jgi:hypothetical protein